MVLPFAMDVKDYNKEMQRQGTPEKCFHIWDYITEPVSGYRTIVKTKQLVKKGKVITSHPITLIQKPQDIKGGMKSFKKTEEEKKQDIEKKKKKKNNNHNYLSELESFTVRRKDY